ncbi:MAG TPA: type II toxin-antitoxin system RelE/ParE family toxin [Tepidisphaeraceae bacterium]|nr:type II toxin-antitoxin system RelE/ParE family toxin [Tepidisphaeraceae bacterium]
MARDNLEAGKRFYDAVLHDMLQLSAMPGMGGQRPSPNPRLKGLRSWPIRGYRNFLIFYLPIENGIDVLRILHGARDVDRVIARSAGGGEA